MKIRGIQPPKDSIFLLRLEKAETSTYPFPSVPDVNMDEVNGLDAGNRYSQIACIWCFQILSDCSKFRVWLLLICSVFSFWFGVSFFFYPFLLFVSFFSSSPVSAKFC